MGMGRWSDTVAPQSPCLPRGAHLGVVVSSALPYEQYGRIVSGHFSDLFANHLHRLCCLAMDHPLQVCLWPRIDRVAG